MDIILIGGAVIGGLVLYVVIANLFSRSNSSSGDPHGTYFGSWGGQHRDGGHQGGRDMSHDSHDHVDSGGGDWGGGDAGGDSGGGGDGGGGE